MIAEPASPAEDTVMVDATPKLDVLDMSVRSFDEPFIPDASTATSPSSDPLYSKRPPPSRIRSASKRTKITVVFDPSKSIFSNAKASSVQFLQSLLDSPKVDILNKETVEVYIKGVSLDMLKYFCGRAIIDSLHTVTPSECLQRTLRVMASLASFDTCAAVVRAHLAVPLASFAHLKHQRRHRYFPHMSYLSSRCRCRTPGEACGAGLRR